MSTKIYIARRVSINRLNDFIDFIRPQVYDHSQKIVERLMSNVSASCIKETQLENSWKKEKLIMFDEAMRLLKDASKSLERNPGCDVDFGINIWLFGRYAYKFNLRKPRILIRG